MEAAEVPDVPEDPTIMLVQKISSETWLNRHVKATAAKEEKMRKHLAAGGPGGGDGPGRQGGLGGRRGPGGRRQTAAPIVLTAPWPEPYNSPYYYAANSEGAKM
ncbi:hypothetical protein CFC21_044094 [Triticum aestivum]|uniref:Uncharacterized protein n=2 Tax=Triticum aestivum TaxID=4565 RepID=A0A9R1JX78_WHEAT|nr:hypothetical protein CFC21_044094 [Triticum aestivum]